MKEIEIENAVYSGYGYKTKKEFEDNTGFNIRVTSYTSYYNANQSKYIRAEFVDPLFSSLTQPTVITVDKDAKEDEIVALFKKKIKYKLRQVRNLEGIKHHSIKYLKRVMSEMYSISTDIIKDEDIIFTKYSGFSFAGVRHSYEGTLTRESVIFYNPPYGDNNHIHELNLVLNYYFGKGVEAITGFKIDKVSL